LGPKAISFAYGYIHLCTYSFDEVQPMVGELLDSYVWSKTVLLVSGLDGPFVYGQSTVTVV
jgi:hypothetical protein